MYEKKEFSGTFWSFLELFGGFCNFLELSRSFRKFLELSVTFWCIYKHLVVHIIYLYFISFSSFTFIPIHRLNLNPSLSPISLPTSHYISLSLIFSSLPSLLFPLSSLPSLSPIYLPTSHYISLSLIFSPLSSLPSLSHISTSTSHYISCPYMSLSLLSPLFQISPQLPLTIYPAHIFPSLYLSLPLTIYPAHE